MSPVGKGKTVSIMGIIACTRSERGWLEAWRVLEIATRIRVEG